MIHEVIECWSLICFHLLLHSILNMFISDNWINRDLGVAALQGDWKNPCCMDELDPHLTSYVGAKPFLPSLPPLGGSWWRIKSLALVEFTMCKQGSCSSWLREGHDYYPPLLVNQHMIYFIIHWTFYGNLLSVNSLCVAVPSYPKEEGFVSSFHISLGGGGGGGYGYK